MTTNSDLAWEQQRTEDLQLAKTLIGQTGVLRDAIGQHLLDDNDLLHADFYRDASTLLEAINNCLLSLRASEVGRR